MNLHTRISQLLTDERLLTNLLAAHGVLALVLLLSLLLRRLLDHGSEHLGRWTGLHWLDGIGKEAKRRGRALIFWSTLGLLALTYVAAIGYHFAGYDIRVHVHEWYRGLTAAQVLKVGVALIELVFLGCAITAGLKLLRRGRRYLESQIPAWMPRLGTAPLRTNAEPDDTADFLCPQQENVFRWVQVLERFLMATTLLCGLWCAGHILHLGERVDHTVEFLMRVLAILMIARLLTLACRTISHALASLGNRHLSASHYQRYWERVTRLFPFGESCFEAAVYVSATSLCIRELEFIAVIADFGPRIVQCIGIFFVTRVVVELLQVLLNEAFGLYNEGQALDQKGQTLVPLLHSLCQYGLYFGSGVTMLSVLGIDTRPILAGAGILGLAGGLGAQSLVTDVVSGFFILFENQYLVGDLIQVGDAYGKVEAVSIRHTQIRDEQGKLYIIPNGQIKSVINYSKGFVNAVIDFKVPTSSSLEAVVRDLAEAGERLRKTRREVLGETVVKGLVDLGPNDMIVRAVTKVQPGTHLAMQNEFRRLLKEIFDQRNSAAKKEPAPTAAPTPAPALAA